MKATVDVITTLEIECDDAIVDELMSESWQHSFYTFDERNDAIAWLAWVVDEWRGPQHVDGLAHLDADQVTVHIVARSQEVTG
jgi:hypothetical protein